MFIYNTKHAIIIFLEWINAQNNVETLLFIIIWSTRIIFWNKWENLWYPPKNSNVNYHDKFQWIMKQIPINNPIYVLYNVYFGINVWKTFLHQPTFYFHRPSSENIKKPQKFELCFSGDKKNLDLRLNSFNRDLSKLCKIYQS